MPIEDGTNISQTPGAFPVNVTKIRKSLHQASLTGEVYVPRAPQPRPRNVSDHAELSLPARSWINSTRHGIPANATTVYLGAGATGASLGTLDRAGMTVRALEPGVEINSLALGAPDITLEGFTVANLTAVPDTPLRGLTLTAMRTVLPLRLSATPRRGVIDLDGAVLDATTVAILRHTGTVVCKGTTLCVTLEGIDHRVLGGTVRREDAAVVASIDKLTAVFGGAWVPPRFTGAPSPVANPQIPDSPSATRQGTLRNLLTTRTCTTVRPGPSSRRISPAGPRRP